MGTISISIPLKVNGSFKIKDPKFAKKLVEELEQLGERTSRLTMYWAFGPDAARLRKN